MLSCGKKLGEKRICERRTIFAIITTVFVCLGCKLKLSSTMHVQVFFYFDVQPPKILRKNMFNVSKCVFACHKSIPNSNILFQFPITISIFKFQFPIPSSNSQFQFPVPISNLLLITLYIIYF